MSLCLVLLLLLWTAVAHADVSCDGVDDDLTSGLATSLFVTATTGSLVLTYVPTGTPGSIGTGCYQGEDLLSDGSGGNLGLFRNGSYAGTQDRLCAYAFDGVDTTVTATYTANVRTHLALVHNAGTMFLYKDGALVSSTPSGVTGGLATALRLCLGAGFSAPGQGRFIEAKTYSVALTAGQIAAEGTSAVRNVIPVAATGRWNFDDCSVGTNGNGVVFGDRSGSAHPLTGNWGANVSGLACLGSSIPYPWGVW
jgi:concanavalin A-like lectin/glucanase superfamily protein